MSAVAFTVIGVPVPQGSLKAILSKSTGRPMVKVPKGRDLAVWRAAIVVAAQRALGAQPPVQKMPVALRCAFVLLEPSSRPIVLKTPKQRRQWERPWRRPDVDKLGRAVLDALTGVLFADDGQVVDLRLVKTYGPTPGAHVTAEWSE